MTVRLINYSLSDPQRDTEIQTIYTELQSDQFNKNLLESEIATIKKDKKGNTQQNKP